MNLKKFGWRLISSIRSHHQPMELEQSTRAWSDSQDFIYDNTQINTKLYEDHWRMRQEIFALRDPVGAIMEFGVFKAQSTNFFAKQMMKSSDTRTLSGFDSFAGFSEEWTGVEKAYSKDRFSLSGSLPQVESNVELIDGFIEESLPRYLEENDLQEISFLHIDTDTYSPAKTVLTLLKPYFKNGTIVVFDELLGYPNWRSHEYRALTEELDRESYEYLGFGVSGPKANLIKAAIRIKN